MHPLLRGKNRRLPLLLPSFVVKRERRRPQRYRRRLILICMSHVFDSLRVTHTHTHMLFIAILSRQSPFRVTFFLQVTHRNPGYLNLLKHYSIQIARLRIFFQQHLMLDSLQLQLLHCNIVTINDYSFVQ